MKFFPECILMSPSVTHITSDDDQKLTSYAMFSTTISTSTSPLTSFGAIYCIDPPFTWFQLSFNTSAHSFLTSSVFEIRVSEFAIFWGFRYQSRRGFPYDRFIGLYNIWLKLILVNYSIMIV